MSHRKSVLSHLTTPFLYTLIGGLLLIIMEIPIYRYMEAKVEMIIVKGAPSYPNEYDHKVFTLLDGTMDKSEVQIPKVNTLYAYIRSEEIDLNAPIYYGDSEKLLLKGVGHYIASGLPGEGKPILMGGHDVTYFAALENVSVGDRIQLSTNYGEYDYIVSNTKITDVTDNSAYDLTEEHETLILYTCYPFGKVTPERSERFFVYADLEVTR